MDLLTGEDLKKLMEKCGEWCVSLFMSTYRGGKETRQNQINFKNKIAKAKESLMAGGLRKPEAQQLLNPAQELLGNRPFWQQQSDGLAMFLSPELVRYYRLPIDFDDLVVVTDHFHIKPLLPIISGDGRFYVMALSQNEVRLLQGSHYNVGEIDLKGVPESLAEALKYEIPVESLQWHTGQRVDAQGGRTGIFHGHGVGVDEAEHKKNILRFFQKIDKGLHEVLGGENAPLVLAGVRYLLPLYRKVNTYSYLVKEGVIGNPDELRDEELHHRAWSIVEPMFRLAQQEAVSKYRKLADTEGASHELEQVVQAAYYKRIEILFVALEVQRWGTFDPDTNTVYLHEKAEPGDQDLLDFAALHTLLNGGTVYAVDLKDVPGNGQLAAVFRF
jgi:hypothetical protein